MSLNGWVRKQRLIRTLRDELVVAVGMNWWKRASNLCKRIDRVRSFK